MHEAVTRDSWVSTIDDKREKLPPLTRKLARKVVLAPAKNTLFRNKRHAVAHSEV